MGKSKKVARLNLLGLGIRGLGQLTEETRKVLTSCDVVLHIGEDHRGLKRLNSNTVDISKMYWTTEDREVVYRRIARHVFECLDEYDTVALVTYGHPLLFDDVNMSLLRSSKRRRIPCAVLPAVSCLDTLSVDLKVDYGDGLQVYEATHLVQNRYVLNPSVHLLLLQIGEFNHFQTSDCMDRRAGHYRPLIRHLRHYYPASHPVTVAYSDDGGYFQKRTTLLAKLDQFHVAMFPGTTLYVPPK